MPSSYGDTGLMARISTPQLMLCFRRKSRLRLVGHAESYAIERNKPPSTRKAGPFVAAESRLGGASDKSIQRLGSASRWPPASKSGCRIHPWARSIISKGKGRRWAPSFEKSTNQN